MGLHQTKKLLRSKRNSHCPQDGRKSLPARLGTNIQNLQETQKTEPPKNQHPSEEMGTYIIQGILKGRGTNDQ
jgi:hypothetical protein